MGIYAKEIYVTCILIMNISSMANII